MELPCFAKISVSFNIITCESVKQSRFVEWSNDINETYLSTVFSYNNKAFFYILAEDKTLCEALYNFLLYSKCHTQVVSKHNYSF